MLFPFRTAIRRFVGTAQLEAIVAKIIEQLNDLKTEFADFRSDVDAKLAQLSDAQGTFSPEAQEIFDGLKQSVAAADASVGDADGSETPASPVDPTSPVEPSEPTSPVDGE